jgi:hypothetical protein
MNRTPRLPPVKKKTNFSRTSMNRTKKLPESQTQMFRKPVRPDVPNTLKPLPKLGLPKYPSTVETDDDSTDDEKPPLHRRGATRKNPLKKKQDVLPGGYFMW